MSDLIDRQAVIEINRSYHGQMPNEVNHRIWKEVNELPSAQADSKETSSTHKALDTISRQMAMEEIFKQRTYKMFEGVYLNANDVRSVLASLPSAQPEIVRCKDCKHQVKEWRDDKRLKEKGYWVYGCKVISDICGYWAWFGQDDEFCSEAERRTDETD